LIFISATLVIAMSDIAPRLVATDLDGTMVGSDGGISARTIAALARIERAGATLVFVTGRPPRWIGAVASAVAHRGLAICANGALVYDLRTERIVRARLIPAEVIAEAAARLRAAVPGVAFAVERESGFAFEAEFGVGHWDPAATLGSETVDAVTLANGPGSKLLAFHPDRGPDELAELATQTVGRLVTVTHSAGHGLIEMSAYGVSKASTLAELCAARGIVPAQVLAFGDMPNDLAMLTWAGMSYAVANAHPDVLAAADRKTASNDDDGVARVVEQFFPETS
jgi:Cof subfamily protein (haloacid dehalogenase superfamily)